MARLLSVIMVFTLGIAAYVTNRSPYKQVMSGESEREIFERFSEELSNISSETGIQIAALDSYMVKVVAQKAVDRIMLGDDRYQALMNEISRACIEYKSGSAYSTQRAGTRIENESYTLVRPYGIIKGEKFEDVPVGVSSGSDFPVEGSVTVPANFKIGNVTITFGGSYTCSYVRNGPNYGTALYDGTPATHGVYIGVVWGAVYRHQFDVVDLESGQRYHVDTTQIETSSSTAYSYTLTASYSVMTVKVNQASTRKVLSYDSRDTFENAIIYNPGELI